MAMMGKEKLCIVLLARPICNYSYYIYILDPYDEAPATEIGLSKDFPEGTAVALVDSTLFMFGGSLRGHGYDTPCYSIRLDDDAKKKEIQFSDMSPIAPMSSKRCCPRAVMIGDKICVFSTYLRPELLNFELYDPATNQWSPLPDPPIPMSEYNKYSHSSNPPFSQVLFHCVEGSVLFISTLLGSSFRFDFGSPSCEWTPCDDLPRVNSGYSVLSQPFIKDGNLGFSSWYSIHDLASARELPGFTVARGDPAYLPRNTAEYFPRDSAIVPLGKRDSERFRACFVETGGHGFVSKYLRVDELLSLYLFQVHDVDDELRTTMIHSRLIKLRRNLWSEGGLYVLGVFPVKQQSLPDSFTLKCSLQEP